MNLQLLKPLGFEYDVPSALADECKPFSITPMVDSLYKSAERRVLVLFNHIPTEDLRAHRLVSGPHGKALASALKLAKAFARSSGLKVQQRLGFAVANYQYFKTYHLESADKKDIAEKAQLKRARALIAKFKPHVILALGNEVSAALTQYDGQHIPEGFPRPPEARRYRGYALPYRYDENIRVIPVHDFTLSGKADDEGEDGDNDNDFGEKTMVAEANLLGYASRCMATVWTEGFRRPFATKIKVNYEFVNTIEKFDAFFELLMTKPRQSVDLETSSLARITNKILTLQAAFSKDKAYVLPLMHRDSPWKSQELDYIRKKLRKWLGRKFDPLNKDYDKYIIGQGFKFDMTPLRVWLNLYAVYWPVWDLQAGEYCFAPQTLVETEEGPKRVDELTSMANPPRVLSYNHATGAQEYKPISGTSEHRTDEDMYEIEYEGGKVQVTGNHKLWSVTRQSYTRADEIAEGELLLPVRPGTD